VISYRQPSGLLFNFKYLTLEYSPVNSDRENLINQQKQEQKIAYKWLENLFKNPQNYPHLISNHTHQSRFYDYLQLADNYPSFAYTLLHQPKQFVSNPTDHIVISILYSKQDSDHREGKFYIGQVLYHLLRNHRSRFLITLCENNNTDERISDGIELIRHLLPVFIINSKSESLINKYEREKYAHLQCILANFQSFTNVKYLLLLQDDAEPISENFYDQLSSLIDYRIQQQWPTNGHRKQPAFIKLYHPRWLIGYFNPSFYVIIQLIATSFFITFLGFYFYRIFIQLRLLNKINSIPTSRFSSNNHQFLLNFFYFLFYFILVILVLILLDHSNVSWTWRSLHPSFYAIYPAPSCCIPAVLFFRETYMEIIEYLNSIQCHRTYAIDTAFDDLPKRTGLQTYLLEPNLLHHIGLYSRLRQKYINPYLLD
jgi:hypothetical protein